MLLNIRTPSGIQIEPTPRSCAWFIVTRRNLDVWWTADPKSSRVSQKVKVKVKLKLYLCST